MSMEPTTSAPTVITTGPWRSTLVISLTPEQLPIRIRYGDKAYILKSSKHGGLLLNGD